MSFCRGQIWVWSVVKKSVLHEFLFVNWHEALMLASDSVPLEVRSEKQRDNFTMWTLNRANQIVVSMCENDDVVCFFFVFCSFFLFFFF